MTEGWDRAPREGARVIVDCRGRSAKEVFLRVLGLCLEAWDEGRRARVAVQNLELLSDSVTRLFKAFDRLAEDDPADIAVEDASGLALAFVDALPGRSHFALA